MAENDITFINASDLKIGDQLVQSMPGLSNYVDKRIDNSISGNFEIEKALLVDKNIFQGDSLTSGVGISGTLEQTRIDNVQMSGDHCVAFNKSNSFGPLSFAANESKAYANKSAAFGNSIAYGSYSLAQGAASKAYGYASHVEGRETQTGLSDYIGCSSNLTAYGCDAHAEGDHTKAIGNFSHAEGSFTEAYDLYSHAEGNYTKVLSGNAGHAEGQQTEVSANYAHAEGTYSKAYGEGAHAEGDNTYAEGSKSHTEGSRTSAIGSCSHAEGLLTIAYGVNSHAEGDQTYAEGQKSHTEGGETSAFGFASHAEGRSSIARARYSHAEGATAEVQKDDEYSFVWSGKFNTNNYYQSKGPGTFSINPNNGLSGFYVGDVDMSSVIAGRASKEELAEMYLSAQTMYNGFILGCVGALSAANAVSSMVVESHTHPGKYTLLIVPTGHLTNSSGAILQQVPAASTFVMAVGALISAISMAGSQYYDGQLA